MEDGDNAHTHIHMIRLEKRRVGVRARAGDADSVEIEAKRGEMKREVFKAHRHAQAAAGFLLRLTDDVAMNSTGVDECDEHDNYEQDECEEARGNPGNNAPLPAVESFSPR